MKKKILISLTLIMAFLLATLLFISNIWLKDQAVSKYKLHSTKQIILLERLLENKTQSKAELSSFLEELSNSLDSRISLISADGSVIYDSHKDPKFMNNHRDRPELKALIKGNDFGYDVRLSLSLDEDYIYCAHKINIEGNEYYLRLSKSLALMSEIDKQSELLFLAIMLIVFLSMFAIWRFAKKQIVDPISALSDNAKRLSKGDFNTLVSIDTSIDEIQNLALSFRKMSLSLSSNIDNIDQKNAELGAILESIIDGVVALDTEKNVFLINDSAKKILDISGNQVFENSLYKLFQDEDLVLFIENNHENKSIASHEAYHAHLGKYIKANIVPIIINSDKIIGSLIIIQDNTNLVKLENVRTDFASNVTHELKTPLTSIRGFVDTLLNGAIYKQDKAIKFLKIINNESDRLSRLIDDILFISQVEHSTAEPNLARLNISKLSQEVMDIMSIQAQRLGLVLNCDLGEDIKLAIKSDHYKQLLINLVDNAIKYTEKGYVDVRISQEDDYIFIRVKDSGIGIAAEHHERMFERFYRVDKARSRRVAGTGLGLSIVKHIVNLYRGHIDFKSALGEGTTFTIKFPAE